MHMVGFAAFALALVAPATALEQIEMPRLTAADVAAAMQAGLPHRYEGGISIVAVAAERDVLVVTFDVPARINAELNRDSIAREFAAGFCGGGDADLYFEQGLRVRVDTSIDGGATLPGLLIDRCPAADGAASESP